MEKMIEINGEAWQVIRMLDEDQELTNDSAEACHLVIQRLADIRPAGELQPYSIIPIMKGSLVRELTN